MRRSLRFAPLLALATLAACASPPNSSPPPAPAPLAAVATEPAASAPELSAEEQRIVTHVRDDFDSAVAQLARTVAINSGTLNAAGVRRVAEAMRPDLERLGFTVRLAQVEGAGRGPHLIAERTGSQGLKLLLIGHLDTVFEEDSPFQRWERVDSATARGPGVVDMKGGNTVILYALKALHDAGALENSTVTVVLTGDEEAPGRPLDASRRDLIEAGRRSDVALGFEGGSRDAEGDLAVIARRSSSGWRLDVTGRGAHSSGVFGDDTGAGAIYEAARILDQFYEELRGDPGLTFNPGVIVGGSEAPYEAATSRGTAFGKSNVVASSAVVTGDIRTLSDEQLERTREAMRRIVGQNLPLTTARITFTDSYPSMSAREENYALLGIYDGVSRALGYGEVRAFDPAQRGAADVSFVAPLIPGMDGLGPQGSGSHTVEERVDLPSLRRATERAALLIYRLTREGAEL
jgi:glutamate carboxypeptidase